MSEYNDDMIIAKRNIAALGAVVAKQETTRQDLEVKVTQLSKQIADQREQIQALTSQMALIRIKFMGTGPS